MRLFSKPMKSNDEFYELVKYILKSLKMAFYRFHLFKIFDITFEKDSLVAYFFISLSFVSNYFSPLRILSSILFLEKVKSFFIRLNFQSRLREQAVAIIELLHMFEYSDLILGLCGFMSYYSS